MNQNIKSQSIFDSKKNFNAVITENQKIHLISNSGNNWHNSPVSNLLSLGCNSIQFINEDDGRSVLLGFFKSFTQVALRLTSQFTHDFRTYGSENSRNVAKQYLQRLIPFKLGLERS